MSVALQGMIGWGAFSLLAVLSLMLAAYGFYVRAPGALFRALAMGFLLAALANPVLITEKREPAPDIALLINDQSPSQALDGRSQQASDAEALLRKKISSLPNLELRTATIRGSADGTRLFEAVQNLLRDTPADRIAGVILLTDGQVHDAPSGAALAKLPRPVHAVLTGDPKRGDRRLVIEQAPRFGIAGDTVSLSLRYENQGEGETPDETAMLSFRLDEGKPQQIRLRKGENHELEFKLEHAGENIVTLEIEPLEGELSTRNNRLALTINGLRQRLRVLLVSGEPNPGERTWRDLLKADPSVDLVHFTILRPPMKQDGTPVEELALISFPTTELFIQKLHEFDLVIFDRYQQGGVLGFSHFDNIASYVEKGGALLTVAGPEPLGGDSLYRTPLAVVFPGHPTGKVHNGGFKPQLTDTGLRHPVTSSLPGANKSVDPGDIPQWGRWFRVVETERLSGHVLMASPQGMPLLILDQFGEGRVAQILSDHGWLWARGFEQGGPQAELLRRLVHWLMKEPDLEEEMLQAQEADGRITIIRRSLLEGPQNVKVTYPDGHSQPVAMTVTAPGVWQGGLEAPEPGIYRITDGVLKTLVAAGQAVPAEYADLQSTAEILQPVTQATGGGLFWLRSDGTPAIRRIQAGRDLAGSNWLGLRDNARYRVLAQRQIPLLPPWLLLLLGGGALALAWRAEGR